MDMKTPISIVLTLAVFFAPNTKAEFTSSVVYDGNIGEFLHRLELFEDYGNKQKLIDSENQLVKFQHEHEDGSLTFKIYKLEILEPSEDLVEFHVSHQIPQGADASDLAKEQDDKEIDIDNALKSLMGFRLPKDHPNAGIWGKRETYTINGLEDDENDRVVATEVSTPVRFSIDDDTGEVKRIDFLSISKTAEGIVGRIRVKIPEQPINFYKLSHEDREELVEELLGKIDNPIKEDPENSETSSPVPIP